MPRHERRVVQLDETNHRSAIPHNFRIVRGWTQAQAAQWYAVSERSWRRYEQRGAPAHLLKGIARWTDRTAAGSEHRFWLVWK